MDSVSVGLDMRASIVMADMDLRWIPSSLFGHHEVHGYELGDWASFAKSLGSRCRMMGFGANHDVPPKTR